VHILIIEDDAKTSQFLAKGLAENGFTVETCRDGQKGLERALTSDFDLLILDVMLPKRDGWSILSELRLANRKVPVLFLTARDGVPDRVKGLQLGADDYLVKPFAFTELLARMQSILRRAAPLGSEVFRIADLELDFVRHRATRGQQRLELTPKEFALLALLARNRGTPVSRESIARDVWEVDAPSESNVVDVHVRRLRAKVDDPFDRPLLHTVRGVGYILEERD